MHILFPLIIAIMTIIYILSWLLKMKTQESREKPSPFECGFDPAHNVRSAFSLRFFTITILFLIFDVELSLMLPVPLLLNSNNMWFLTFNSLIFMILVLGLLVEWTQKTLEWY